MFDYTSRYYNLPTASYTHADGSQVSYVRRRFLPPVGNVTVLAEVSVTQNDRLDLIAARTLGVPEQFWRICDANRAMNPPDLTAPDQIGRRLVVPMPQAGA